MNKFSRLFCSWLALTLTSAHAQYTYTTNSGAVTITAYAGPGGALTFPSTIHGMPVTSIAECACQGVTSLTIPDSVTNIGEDAFGYNRSLTSVKLGNGLIGTGEDAFEGCSALTNVVIGTNIFSIDSGSFGACGSLSNITIPTNVTIIAGGAFGGTGLTSIAIPDTVTNIGDEAFGQCGNLTNISIPNSVTSIGVYAFETDPIRSLTIGTGVASIGDGAFSSCSDLKAVTIPDLVTNIGDFAFQNCTLLTAITLGASVNSIGTWAFKDCYSLASLTLPASVTNIGYMAFYGCYGMTHINVAPNNPAYSSLDGVLFNKDRSVLVHYPASKSASVYAVPQTVTGIGTGAFVDCSGTTSVMIPNSVTSLGPYAFELCSVALTGIYFEGNAPSMDSTAFFDSAPTVYYLPGTAGWDSLYYSGTALWTQPQPTILSSNSDWGATTNGFGFTVSWATNVPVVVEACTNLANPIWDRLETNILTNGVFYFKDPQPVTQASRFYRVVTP
jgi:hypothetical protein